VCDFTGLLILVAGLTVYTAFVDLRFNSHVPRLLLRACRLLAVWWCLHAFQAVCYSTLSALCYRTAVGLACTVVMHVLKSVV
jgi:hypothetical protein